MSLDPSIVLAVRVLGALVFGTAVYGKLRHQAEFMGVVANYRLLPGTLVEPSGWLIIGLELLVVVSLTSGGALSYGASLGAILLGGFALAMAINLARGRDEIDCGCFQSARRQPLGPMLVARNLLLAVTLLLLCVRVTTGAAFAAQRLDGLAAGVVLFVLYRTVGELVAVRHAADLTRKRFA